MKKIFALLIAVMVTASVFAQSPEKMSYQAVVRNATDALVQNSPVGMQISILQGNPNGNAVYVETQMPMTNDNGLVSLEIGGGTVVSGNFSAIDWTAGPYFIQTEVDPEGGTSYSITGTSQMMSVPYAMYADRAEEASTAMYAQTAGHADTTNYSHTTEQANISNYAYNAGQADTATYSPNAGHAIIADRLTEQVAFSAQTNASQTIPNALSTDIAFAAEVYDDGNNYDPSTGKFTAPSTGLYHFDVNLTENGGSGSGNVQAYLYLAVNTPYNYVVGNQAMIAPSIFVPFSISKDLKLNAGDTVYVRAFTYGGNEVVHGAFSSFSGHKVY